MTAYTTIRLPGEASAPGDAGGARIGSDLPAPDLPALWAMFRRRFGLFLAAALTTLALVVIATFQMTPLYEAEARIVIKNRETQALDYASIIAGVSPDAAAVDTEVEILLSRTAAAAVAEQLDLWDDEEFGGAEAPGLLDRFAPAQVARGADERLSRERTIEQVLDAVEAERAGITYAIAIRAVSQDPQKAAAIANAFAEQYIDDQLAQKFGIYDRANVYLVEAVARAREEWRSAEEAVEQYRGETGLLSAEGTLLSEQQVTQLQAQLIVQEADLAERRARLTTVQRRLSLGAGLDAIAAVTNSPVINDLRAKQADLARRKAELQTRYGPLHPQVDKVNSEAADVDRQIEAETQRVVTGLENEVRVAENRVATLRTRIGGLEADLGSDNAALVRLRELEREAEVAEANWQSLRTRSRESAQLTDLIEADARVSDPAALPTAPAYPDKVLNLALGLLLGAAMGGLAVALAEVFDNGLRTGEDVERHLNTRLVAAVPELTARTARGQAPEDYLVDKPLSAFAEAYRTVRSALQLSGDEPSKVVAVTSAVSGEGKTVSALCLARIAALSGDRTLIIDGDLRRRVLSRRFGTQGAEGTEDADGVPRGLAEVLAGRVPLRSALVRDEATGLDVLPVSEDRSGTGDLFGSARFSALMAKLRTRYDLIVLDTAPLTAVADTRLAVASADAALLFVRWKETPVPLAKSAAKVIAETKTPLVGAVVTRIDGRAQAGYGYEGSNAYYASHGKYYFD